MKKLSENNFINKSWRYFIDVMNSGCDVIYEEVMDFGNESKAIKYFITKYYNKKNFNFMPDLFRFKNNEIEMFHYDTLSFISVKKKIYNMIFREISDELLMENK